MKKILIVIILLTGSINSLFAKDEVVIYSYRQPFLLKPLLEAFKEKTGIQTKTLFLKKGLAERLEGEGNLSPADIVLTVDVYRLNELVKKKLIQPVQSRFLNRHVPKALRHPQNLWFAQSLRARVIYASKKNIPRGTIQNYEDLSNPKWKNQICTRSGKHRYNIGLFASFIAEKGRDKTKEWLKAVKTNLARKPQGNDRSQVKAIYAGECNLSLGNSYYLGVMANNKKNPIQKKWAASVYPITPNQKESGTHMNISGMALTKASSNKKKAIQLMEFFLSKEAQKIYADLNYEFPVRKGVEPSDFLKKEFGKFKKNFKGIAKIAENSKIASELVDEVRFDF